MIDNDPIFDDLTHASKAFAAKRARHGRALWIAAGVVVALVAVVIAAEGVRVTTARAKYAAEDRARSENFAVDERARMSDGALRALVEPVFSTENPSIANTLRLISLGSYGQGKFDFSGRVTVQGRPVLVVLSVQYNELREKACPQALAEATFADHETEVFQSYFGPVCGAGLAAVGEALRTHPRR